MSNKKNNINTKLNAKDLLELNKTLQTNVDDDKVYWLRNDAKLRAVYTSQNYDEFRGIVDAAHLTPLDNKKDKINGANAKTIWNKYASKNDDDE